MLCCDMGGCDREGMCCLVMKDEVSCAWDMLGVGCVPSFLIFVGGVFLEVGYIYIVVVGWEIVTLWLWSQMVDSVTQGMISACEIGDFRLHYNVEFTIALLDFHLCLAPFCQRCG